MSNSVDKEEYWADRLHEYENTYLPFSILCTDKGTYDKMVARHVQELEPYKYLKVLDAGCAYGRMSEYFEDYTGIDFVHAFIDKAKKLYPNKNFMVANLKNLPFKDKEFDVAFCVMVRENVVQNLGHGEWVKMQRELYRVAEEVIILEP